MTTCPRCLKEFPMGFFKEIPPVDPLVHPCTPTHLVRDLEARLAEYQKDYPEDTALMRKAAKTMAKGKAEVLQLRADLAAANDRLANLHAQIRGEVPPADPDLAAALAREAKLREALKQAPCDCGNKLGVALGVKPAICQRCAALAAIGGDHAN